MSVTCHLSYIRGYPNPAQSANNSATVDLHSKKLLMRDIYARNRPNNGPLTDPLLRLIMTSYNDMTAYIYTATKSVMRRPANRLLAREYNDVRYECVLMVRISCTSDVQRDGQASLYRHTV